MSAFVVAVRVPRSDHLGLDDPDGAWRMTPRARMATVRSMAKAMQVTPLAPYVRIGQGLGVVRATAVRALRRQFGDGAALASECLSCRTLSLAAAYKVIDPSVRWADMSELNEWPMALRVDARRLAERFTVLASALWCRACDSEPAASAGLWCLWCEHHANPPRVAASTWGAI